jgi:iron-sulfur cluster assembly protein
VLTLTDHAVAAIRNLTSQLGLPAETGLRIAPEDGRAGGLALSLSDGPQAGDQVIEEADVHVFVQPDAAAALDDKALDAQVNEDGEVSFQLQSQGCAGPAAARAAMARAAAMCPPHPRPPAACEGYGPG